MIAMVYKTGTPDWSKIDPLISAIQAAGQHAMLQFNQSPSWLQPTSGTCSGNVYAAPTDITQWAQIAAAYVAHMDSTFPGVVQDYEIWNEPNATGMCAADHLDTYLAIYAAAAPAMKAQASQDGATIRVGGPALSGYSAYWLSALLTNSATAPYVDFVSYHQYIFGSSGLQAQWDTYNGNISLYEATQDPANGAFASYNKVLAQVALGNQPGGAQTPVYITEYNTNWTFFEDCCRNDATYAPVWNALYVTDLLNSVYNGTAKVPDKIIYFAGSAYPWFCMIGVQDTNMDCLNSVGATLVPYPQYYTYQLLASSNYLGLSGGGYMAKTLSTPTGGGGLATTAFYTASQDAIVITNPTSTAYSQIPVTFANPGFSNTQGTLYTIENGAQINSSAISFSVQGTSLTTTIDIPPYSVQAISLQ
jgi:virulence-associated protein VapD